MPKYYYAAKKSKKKTQKNSSGPWLRTVLYILAGTVDLWLFYILWFNASQGMAGKEVAEVLFQLLGQSAGLLPLFLAYWLLQTIRNKSASFLFFLIGTAVTLGGFSSVLTLLKLIFKDSLLSGGAAGQKVFYALQSVCGSVGAALFSLALVLVGLHLLFAIPWSVVLKKTAEFIRNDFNGWMEARAELKEKVAEGRAEIKEKSAKETTARPVAEEIHEVPEIHRSKPEIRRPVAEPVHLPRREELSAQKLPDTQDAQHPAAEENGEAKKFDPKTFQLPPLSLLNDPVGNGIVGPTDDEIAKATRRLEDTLKSFDIRATVTGVSPGPVVTRYEIKPDPGVTIASITARTQDIQASMEARSVRVQAPIPGKNAVGFEIPNDRPVMVTMKEILQSPVYANSKAVIPIALGRYADGDPAGSVAEKWPHILIAGATNSGKSICLHTIIMSILYKHRPDEVKFLMIDPKRVELTLYEGIPYLYDPKTSCDDVDVVTDANGAAKSLQMLVKVMEKRLSIMQLAKVKNIEGYNQWAKQNNEEKMFYIFVIIDEMADLMLQTKASIEDSVQRLAQMGRALGIHLILCTQRPSVKVVTGVIKANLPSRIALQVASAIDSKVILDATGAEDLLGKGDMLYQSTSDKTPLRIQGAYVSEKEIKAVADFLRAQGGPDYPVQIVAEQNPHQRPQDGLGTSPEELLQALNLIKERRRVSQDLLKAHFGSSARATNMLSVLEMKGYISKPEGSNRWEIHYEMIDQAIEELSSLPYDKNYQEPTYETVYK
ncbi:MAG: DNA translocase FtsK [Elusimicrobia bacterium]|nr:DNA translocase FtsK [Elusimicrobiota bacterium]MDD7502104.1 DNA translocase FtsK [Elusimicrobiota bacterium]MDY5729549.1 DNA translocase FtsK [Elusimicrobiaceae bacterium]